MTDPDLAYDAASYRDRHARVYFQNGRVLRGLSPVALANWRRTSAAPFFPAMVAEGKIVATEEETPAAGWAAVLHHERIPVVSYPYEWSFGMLRDAADLQLEIILRALRDGIAVRDATPFNIQWKGHRPTFIDIVSFAPFVEGTLWAGYRQFCETFLFPLFLQAYRGVDFHPFLRGALDGIQASQMARLLSGRDRLRAGVLTHVVLQEKLQERFRGASSQGVEGSVRATGAESRALIEMNVTRLRRLVERLGWEPSGGGWEEYERTNTYSDADRDAKERFVRTAIEARRPRLTLDIGCNTGTFSRIAAESSEYVVALDADHAVVERLYRRLRAEGGAGTILPLVWDAVDPSPGLGWRGAERKPFPARVEADLVLALALIHHLVIGRNVPLREVIEFFGSLGATLVIEFVDRDDPMAKHLLAQKDEAFEDYAKNVFEAELARRFEIAASESLPSGSRTLYVARPRAPRA